MGAPSWARHCLYGKGGRHEPILQINRENGWVLVKLDRLRMIVRIILLLSANDRPNNYDQSSTQCDCRFCCDTPSLIGRGKEMEVVKKEVHSYCHTNGRILLAATHASRALMASGTHLTNPKPRRSTVAESLLFRQGCETTTLNQPFSRSPRPAPSPSSSPVPPAAACPQQTAAFPSTSGIPSAHLSWHRAAKPAWEKGCNDS